MKKGKPRGPVPSLIGSTLGTPRRVPIKKQCDCKRCGAPLVAGQDCVAIPQLGGGFVNLRRYCEECFKAILGKTQSDLDELANL